MQNSRTYTFYALNAVRFISIVALILVFSSSIMIMVQNVQAFNEFEAVKGTEEGDDMLDCDYIEGSTIPNQAAGVFWAILSSLLIIFQTIVLIMSEFGWPNVFFERYFPVLGPNFGLGALGIFQTLMAAQILSHHVDTFPLVAAFFLFSISCINMLLGLVFRESAKQRRSITAWRSGDDAKGILPTTTVDIRPAFVSAHSTGKSSGSGFDNDYYGYGDEKTNAFGSFGSFKRTEEEKASLGFGRKGEKAAGLRGFMLQRPEESLPRYASPSPRPTTPPAPSPVTMPAPQHNDRQVDEDDDEEDRQRHISVRTSTSSFASPGPAPGRQPYFRSSPTAL